MGPTKSFGSSQCIALKLSMSLMSGLIFKTGKGLGVRNSCSSKISNVLLALSSPIKELDILNISTSNNRGHPNLRGANPCVRFSPFVDFFGVFSLFYEAGQPPSQLARECTPMLNLSISSQGTT